MSTYQAADRYWQLNAPTLVKTASKPSVKYPALSRIRYRMLAVRASSRLIRRNFAQERSAR